MTDHPYYSSQRNLYVANAKWGADGLDPRGIAARIVEMLDRTIHLVPPGQRWFILPRKGDRYAPITQSLPEIVQANEIPGDFGEPNPGWGYSNVLLTLENDQGSPTNTSLSIFVTAGSNSLNHISFEIGGSRFRPDYSRLNYQSYRDMIGAIAEAWPCPWIFADNSRSPRVHPPADVAVNGPLKPPFGGAWIVYLSAPLVKGLAPPADLVMEPTAGGGLFLSTARTLLDQSSADEMRRSRLLEKIARERIGIGTGGGLPQMTPVRIGAA
jgi:hypothetical protein